MTNSRQKAQKTEIRSSVTTRGAKRKATYDAVANKFRALWGKEAGWAHSVLFTADLRAFSERLVEKVEAVEVKTVIKTEDGDVLAEGVKQEAQVVKRKIKAEPVDEETKILQVSERSVRASKRRRNL